MQVFRTGITEIKSMLAKETFSNLLTVFIIVVKQTLHQSHKYFYVSYNKQNCACCAFGNQNQRKMCSCKMSLPQVASLDILHWYTSMSRICNNEGVPIFDFVILLSPLIDVTKDTVLKFLLGTFHLTVHCKGHRIMIRTRRWQEQNYCNATN